MASQGGFPVHAFTATHVISGTARPRSVRTLDWLNESTLSSILLYDVSYLPLSGHATATPVQATEVRLFKSELLVVLPEEQARRLPQLNPARKPRQRVPVMLLVGPFELTGALHLVPGESTQLMHLLRGPGPFFPLTSARLVYPPEPGLSFGPVTALVQRDRVGLLQVVG